MNGLGWARRVALAAVLPLWLVACGGGGSDGGSDSVVPVVTSVTVSIAAGDIRVGQTQAVTAEARDQNGAVMPTASFTWASSNSSVASVTAGVVTGVAAGSASITASSGGVTSNPAPVSVRAVAMGSVTIDKPSVFFPRRGQSLQLTAQLLDAQGVALSGNVSWTSSAPDKVAVDASGRLVAAAIGSAQIFAQSGAVRSAPTLVFVAEPQPGALLVTDAQVLAVGPPLRLGAGETPGIGTEFEVTLQGVAAPAPGTVVLATETAPVAGKVVAVRQDAAGTVVTLALAPLYELLANYDIDWAIELSAFALEPVPARAAGATKGPVWTQAKRPTQRERAEARRLDDEGLKPFKAFDCDAKLEPQFVITKVSLAPEIDLKLYIVDRPGYSKHVLEGSASLSGSAGATLNAGFKAEGKCEAARQFRIPVGWLSLVVMPAVRIGLGLALEGEVRLVQGELGVEGKIGFSPQLGWECGGAAPGCRAFDQIAEINEFKTKSQVPSVNDMQLKAEAQFYILAGLDASLFLGLANAKIVEARVGPKQSFDLGFDDDQAARSEYAATYDLKLEGVIEPGADLAKAIKRVINDDATSVKFKAGFSKDISESPKGSLSVSKSRVGVGQTVEFNVELDDKTLEYEFIGYNVDRLDLYRKRSDETAFVFWKSMDQIGSNLATYKWQTTTDDVGKYEFAAFVNTKILVPVLEVAKNSVKPVEVTCYSVGPLAALPGTRAQAQAAPGHRRRPQATDQCTNTWAGPASYTAKTPGLPTANIAATASISWTYRADLSGNGVETYVARGSFDLAFNDPLCTIRLSPNHFDIVEDPLTPSRLSITDNGFTPPVYGFSGSQFVNFTATSSCPGRSDVVTEFRGFLASFAYGNGPFTGQTQLAGEYEDAAEKRVWDFRRP